MVKRFVSAFALIAAFGLSAQAFAQDSATPPSSGDDGAQVQPADGAKGAEATSKNTAADVDPESVDGESDTETSAQDDAASAEETTAAADAAGEAVEDKEAAQDAADAAQETASQDIQTRKDVDQEEADQNAAAAAGAAAAAADAAASAVDATQDQGKASEGRWSGALSISGSINLAQLSHIPGAPNGLSVGMNASVDGNLDLIKGKHEWRNTLMLNAGVLKAASEPIWAKTNDTLELNTGYYFDVTDWFGPFVDITFQTSMFPLRAIGNGSGSVFHKLGADGEYHPVPVATGYALRYVDATDAFQPLQLDEKFGLFFRPVDHEDIRLSFRTGFAGQEFFVKDGAWMEDHRSDDGNDIYLNPLTRYQLLGYFADLQLRGYPENEQIVYGADASIVYPFALSTPKSERLSDNPLQATFSAFVTVKLAEWASVDVRAGTSRIPQVTGDTWQYKVQALLTFSYAVIGDVDKAREAAGTLRHIEDDYKNPASLEAPDL